MAPYKMGERLKRPDVESPVIALDQGEWLIWVCSRCGKQEHELPPSTRQQIAGLRAGTWPTPGMRDVWPGRCFCGGVVREITVTAKPRSWSCPSTAAGALFEARAEAMSVLDGWSTFPHGDASRLDLEHAVKSLGSVIDDLNAAADEADAGDA